MKKTIVIIICVLVLLGAVAAGLILFLPRNETIHIENPFVKTHIADAEVQGDMPEGTKLDSVIDITVTVNNAGLCCASGTIKLGEQTFDVNDVTVSADGYTLSKKDNGRLPEKGQSALLYILFYQSVKLPPWFAFLQSTYSSYVPCLS